MAQVTVKELSGQVSHGKQGWAANSADPPSQLRFVDGFKDEFFYGKSNNSKVNCAIIRTELILNYGRIHLGNIGSGCKISVDGVEQTGLKVIRHFRKNKENDRFVREVSPGTHVVLIEKEGFKDWTGTFVVVGQQRTYQEVVLEQE